MRKKILFALTAILISTCSIMARDNTADKLIKENRNNPYSFYVNLTNRYTAKRTYRKSLEKAIKFMTEEYGDSISTDSIMKMLPLEPSFFDKHVRISKLKCKVVVAMDHEIADFAAALDSASDAYCLFELNCKADTVLLDGMNKEIAQTIMSLVKNDAGMSYYTTPYPFGFVMVLYSERRNIQSIVYARRRPFRIFF